MENSANSNAREIFLQLCISTNVQFANKERKSTRGNKKHFSNKSLACGHKQRKRYRNSYLKNGGNENKMLSVKQRNCCSFLLTKAMLFIDKSKKEKHHVNSNHKNIAANKNFWKTVKPTVKPILYLSETGDEKILSGDKKIQNS